MIDVVKAILRKLGVNLENVAVRRLVIDYNNSGVIPTNDWTMTFLYKGSTFTIGLHELGSEEAWIDLIRYHTAKRTDVRKVEAINTSPQELYKIINYFINK